MAEIIVEPTALSKVIPLKFKINDVDVPKTTQLSTNKQFNTTDTDAWFTFELDGLASTGGTYDLTLINLDDKSIFHHANVLFQALPFHYKLNSSEDVTLNEIRHAGRWLGQLVVTLSNGDTTARQFGFNIAGHILDGQDAQVILLSDYQALINTINLAKDDLAQYNVDYAALIADVTAAEGLREQAEIDRAATFDALVESEMIAQNVETKLTEKEATFAPRMLSVEQQLAEKIGGGVKAEPEDLSATTLGLVTGTGGPINLLSIPQDKSATWAKRTETGSFAKILLTGEVPNFNTSTGILTFPSDFRILVGTNYYSIAATTIDFSALVSTASQILILFDVSTLAFTAISPTSLTSAHDRSVIVATIKNVSGQRREPYMNCPFTVNNIPYVPDIEKMLLSKAIPLTNQITLFHVSGVLNMIQHKDSLGNTIRTDTFTFSPTTIVEERKHNLSNTKITFTTNLSTFTTEVN